MKRIIPLFSLMLLFLTSSFAQSQYCNTQVYHLGIAAEVPSSVFVTISNLDATSMYVEVESADADAVDDLIVANGSGATISDIDASVPGKLRRTLTWATPPADVTLNVLWSKASFGGNWQLSPTDITVPFNASCGGQTTPMDGDITFSVDMNQYDGTIGTGVYVNGTFNNWCGDCNPMDDTDGDGIWTVTLPLTAGLIEYKFTVDGWTDEEMLTDGSPCTMTTGGNTNRVHQVDGDADLGVVCWESCDETCGGGTTGPEYCNTQVYHLGIEAEVPSSVFLTISNLDATSMYVEVESADTDVVDDLIVINGSGATISDIDASVPGKLRRTLTWATPPADVALNVLWSKASFGGNWQLSPEDITVPFNASCGGQTTPMDGEITFSVDMNQYDGTIGTGVYVNGTFNNWCGDCNPMDDTDGDGIWTVTLPLTAGLIEYKFTVDGWTDEEMLTEGSSCTMTTDGNTNRFHQVDGDADLGVVCWESCDETCPTTVDMYDVTFHVDMNEYQGTFTTLNLSGSFNGWCGTCAPMADDDGDGIWTITVQLAADTFEYKFTLDDWAVEEEFAGGEECTSTIDGFTNRSIVVTEAAELPPVCWNSCEECTVSTTGNIKFEEFSIHPNPAQDLVAVKVLFAAPTDASLQLIDITGRTVFSTQVENEELTLDVSSYPTGIYLMMLKTAEGQAVERLMITQ